MRYSTLRFGVLAAVVTVAVVGVSRSAVAAAPTATFTTVNDWGSGFQGQYTITNPGPETVNGWRLEFDLPADANIDHYWNAQLTRDGQHFTFTNRDYNATIAPGDSTGFGFIGSPGGVEPQNCRLNDGPCDGSDDDDDQPVPLEDLAITTTQVASGLARPTAITAPDDGSGRLFITEKPGTVRVYHPSTGIDADPLLDIGDRVDVSGNERGLLGIVTSPDFGQNPELYVAYTSVPDGTLTLSRFRLDSADQSPVPADREEILLTQQHSQFSNHNGGQLAFGPDGYLYWSLGDGGGAGDSLMSGQNLGTLLGKILRLDVSGACDGQAYCVPDDNPFVGEPGARPEIWAYGLRNAWRFSFDADGGSAWIADVGQGSFEEVNHLTAGVAGANFGWSCREGPEIFEADRCQPGAEFTDPVFWYETSLGRCAVIGGHVYRGDRFAELAAGTYVATDYCSGTAWGVRPADGGSHESQQIGELPIQVTTFGVDAAGEFYVATDLPGGLHTVSFELRD